MMAEKRNISDNFDGEVAWPKRERLLITLNIEIFLTRFGRSKKKVKCKT
jgi:hypothetical protein